MKVRKRRRLSALFCIFFRRAARVAPSCFVCCLLLLFFLLLLARRERNLPVLFSDGTGDNKDRLINRREEEDDNPISIWYGPTQRFGNLGKPQPWINVLGNVDISLFDNIDASNIEVAYRLDGISNSPRSSSATRSVNLGSDLHRLAQRGDFNIDLSWDELVQAGGTATLVISANATGDNPSKVFERKVNLMVEEGNSWPMPYEVDFSTVNNLQDVVQIVDGHWKLESMEGSSGTIRGVRTVHPYYDRFFAFGDEHFYDYVVTAKVIVHSFVPPAKGPPTYDCTHVSIGLRWRGHHADRFQPYRKYYPVGAFGEFMLRTDKNNRTTGRWRIIYDGDYKSKPPLKSKKTIPIVLGEPIYIQARAKTMPDGQSTQYSFRQRPAASESNIEINDDDEDWDVVGIETMTGDYPSGAAAMVPHNSNVTVIWVKVRPIEN